MRYSRVLVYHDKQREKQGQIIRFPSPGIGSTWCSGMGCKHLPVSNEHHPRESGVTHTQGQECRLGTGTWQEVSHVSVHVGVETVY